MMGRAGMSNAVQSRGGRLRPAEKGKERKDDKSGGNNCPPREKQQYSHSIRSPSSVLFPQEGPVRVVRPIPLEY